MSWIKKKRLHRLIAGTLVASMVRRFLQLSGAYDSLRYAIAHSTCASAVHKTHAVPLGPRKWH